MMNRGSEPLTIVLDSCITFIQSLLVFPSVVSGFAVLENYYLVLSLSSLWVLLGFIETSNFKGIDYSVKYIGVELLSLFTLCIGGLFVDLEPIKFGTGVIGMLIIGISFGLKVVAVAERVEVAVTPVEFSTFMVREFYAYGNGVFNHTFVKCVALKIAKFLGFTATFIGMGLVYHGYTTVDSVTTLCGGVTKASLVFTLFVVGALGLKGLDLFLQSSGSPETPSQFTKWTALYCYGVRFFPGMSMSAAIVFLSIGTNCLISLLNLNDEFFFNFYSFMMVVKEFIYSIYHLNSSSTLILLVFYNYFLTAYFADILVNLTQLFLLGVSPYAIFCLFRYFMAGDNFMRSNIEYSILAGAPIGLFIGNFDLCFITVDLLPNALCIKDGVISDDPLLEAKNSGAVIDEVPVNKSTLSSEVTTQQTQSVRVSAPASSLESDMTLTNKVMKQTVVYEITKLLEHGNKDQAFVVALNNIEELNRELSQLPQDPGLNKTGKTFLKSTHAQINKAATQDPLGYPAKSGNVSQKVNSLNQSLMYIDADPEALKSCSFHSEKLEQAGIPGDVSIMTSVDDSGNVYLKAFHEFKVTSMTNIEDLREKFTANASVVDVSIPDPEIIVAHTNLAELSRVCEEATGLSGEDAINKAILDGSSIKKNIHLVAHKGSTKSFGVHDLQYYRSVCEQNGISVKTLQNNLQALKVAADKDPGMYQSQQTQLTMKKFYFKAINTKGLHQFKNSGIYKSQSPAVMHRGCVASTLTSVPKITLSSTTVPKAVVTVFIKCSGKR